ncbi:MAG TPA: hypothetical protein VGF28_12425 [Thermoanaerobaculia bacterium]|jgi:hypothetical protein
MIDLTPSARQRLDEYLRRLRQSLRRASPAEADDVEQSVREHIEVALAGFPAPVGGEQVAEVLDRLGAPNGWVPEDERSVAQRVIQQVTDRLRSGPEEWRLAYVTFGLFLVALLLMPVGIGFFLMIASFLASRAYLDYMETRQEAPGARRWLVYPPIGFFLALATAFFVVGPAGPIVGWGIGDEGFLGLLEESGLRAPYHEAQFVAGAAVSVLGAWWTLASLLGMAFLPVIRFIFKPLLARVRRPHFLGLTVIGALSLAVGFALLRPWVSQLW